MTTPQISFKRNAVEPVACIQAAWELIKDRYWLFVGMSAVGIMIASAVPLGILMGPMMCGLFLTIFKRLRREPIEFGDLFKGFEHFGPSVVATLLHLLPILAIIIPAYVLFYLGIVLSVVVRGGDDLNPAAVLFIVVAVLAFWIVVFFLVAIFSIGFTFAYPLITDRQMQGFDAVKLSFKAAKANFWRLLGLTILTFMMNLTGFLLCYIGVFLVLPISYASIGIAYKQVFGLRDPSEVNGNLPPPPPVFN